MRYRKKYRAEKKLNDKYEELLHRADLMMNQKLIENDILLRQLEDVTAKKEVAEAALKTLTGENSALKERIRNVEASDGPDKPNHT